MKPLIGFKQVSDRIRDQCGDFHPKEEKTRVPF